MNNNIKTIGFVSTANPFTDRRAWSGTVFKIRESIENAGFKVKWIKIDVPPFLTTIIKTILKIRYGATLKHPWLLRLMSRFTNWTATLDCDLLFFPGLAQIMNYSKCKKPYIYYADACISQLMNYYDFGINQKLIDIVNKDEQKAIQNAILNIRASKWASQCAVEEYGGNPAKNLVLEFGANLDDKDIVKTKPYEGGKLNILFSGVDWNRKGGDVAVDTIILLREKYGIDATLSIVGIRQLPEKYQNLDFINNFGFLNKNDAEEYNKYIDTIKNCHLLLLPTRAECAGIVFCEASAFGMPSFTYDTGGVGNYVINGINGYRLPLSATGKDFAERIYKSIKNNEFFELNRKSMKLYDESLSWKSWSFRFKEIIENNIN